MPDEDPKKYLYAYALDEQRKIENQLQERLGGDVAPLARPELRSAAIQARAAENLARMAKTFLREDIVAIETELAAINGALDDLRAGRPMRALPIPIEEREQRLFVLESFRQAADLAMLADAKRQGMDAVLSRTGDPV